MRRKHIYLEFFGLTRRPFATAPDPMFFFASEKHQEALASLLYVIEERLGFGLITGEVGAGKTTVCRAALAHLEGRAETAVITNTMFDAKELLEAVCDDFDLSPAGLSKYQLLRKLNEFLIEKYTRDVPVVLIIDEAQNLDNALLEEVRLLGNLETEDEKLIQIILLGQPELRRKIGSPELYQLNQRISVRFHLPALNLQESVAYVRHRLKLAGAGEQPIFDPMAEQEIYRYTGGVPRLINTLCEHTLLQAYITDRHAVSAALVAAVAQDLSGYSLTPPAERTSHDALFVPVADVLPPPEPAPPAPRAEAPVEMPAPPPVDEAEPAATETAEVPWLSQAAPGRAARDTQVEPEPEPALVEDVVDVVVGAEEDLTTAGDEPEAQAASVAAATEAEDVIEDVVEPVEPPVDESVVPFEEQAAPETDQVAAAVEVAVDVLAVESKEDEFAYASPANAMRMLDSHHRAEPEAPTPAEEPEAEEAGEELRLGSVAAAFKQHDADESARGHEDGGRKRNKRKAAGAGAQGRNRRSSDSSLESVR